MKVTMNSIEYTTSVSNGSTKVSWDTGSQISSLSETETLKSAVLAPIRNQRNTMLSESDWRVTIDYPGADQQEWISYRTKLRDLPSTYTQGEDLIFPTEPGTNKS